MTFDRIHYYIQPLVRDGFHSDRGDVIAIVVGEHYLN